MSTNIEKEAPNDPSVISYQNLRETLRSAPHRPHTHTHVTHSCRPTPPQQPRRQHPPGGGDAVVKASFQTTWRNVNQHGGSGTDSAGTEKVGWRHLLDASRELRFPPLFQPLLEPLGSIAAEAPPAAPNYYFIYYSISHQYLVLHCRESSHISSRKNPIFQLFS